MEVLGQIQREKAKICNRQFQSALTREGDSDPPSKGACLWDIPVDPKGAAKLLDGLLVNVLGFFLQNTKTALPGVMIKI